VRILIVKLSAIGDVIHTLPAVNAIRRHWPHCRITWVVESAAADLVLGHPAINRVIVSHRKTWIRGLGAARTRTRSVQAIRRFIGELRDTRYDLVIDFQQLLKSGILVRLARGAIKAGFDRGMEHMEESQIFLNRRIPPVSMEIHALRRNLMLIEALGIPADAVTYDIPAGPREYRRVSDMLPPAQGKKRIAINPVAQWPTKLWPDDRFARLADRLIADHRAQVVFTGGPADAGVVNGIIARMDHRPVNLTGRTRITELAALYRMADLVISTDTGPMHLAAAMGAPTLALFGPTAPWRTGPFGPENRVIRTGAPCSPCFKRACRRGDHICMAGIGVEEVLAAAITSGQAASKQASCENAMPR